jgi:hypothetical protein
MPKECTVRNSIIRILKELGVNDPAIEKETEKIAFSFLQHNPHVAPDSLARAAIFLAKSKHNYVSAGDVRKISQNGGKENTSWMVLTPEIMLVTGI